MGRRRIKGEKMILNSTTDNHQADRATKEKEEGKDLQKVQANKKVRAKS